MSGVIVKEVTVAANSVDENILSGSAFEFARQNSFVSMGIVSSDVDTFVTIQAGGNIVAEEFSPPIEATAFPQTNEDFYFNTFAVTGDRLVVRVRNDNAAERTIRCVVQVTDV